MNLCLLGKMCFIHECKTVFFLLPEANNKQKIKKIYACVGQFLSNQHRTYLLVITQYHMVCNDEDIEMIMLMSRKYYPSLCEALKEVVNKTGE